MRFTDDAAVEEDAERRVRAAARALEKAESDHTAARAEYKARFSLLRRAFKHLGTRTSTYRAEHVTPKEENLRRARADLGKCPLVTSSRRNRRASCLLRFLMCVSVEVEEHSRSPQDISPKGKGKGKGKPPPPGKGKGKAQLPQDNGPKGKGKGIGKPPPLQQAKMKPLGWQKITEPKDGSFWANQREVADVKIDQAKLEQLFDWSALGRREDVSGVSKGKVSLTGQTRAMGICVVLHHRAIKHVRPQRLRDAILALDGTVLTPEVTELLLACDPRTGQPIVLPTTEEIEAVRSHLETELLLDSLDEASKFLLVFHDVPHLHERLLLHQFRGSFAEKFSQIQKQLSIMTEALMQVKSSKRLASILDLVLEIGNFLNGGTSRGDARGFRLSVLGQLSHMKQVLRKSPALNNDDLMGQRRELTMLSLVDHLVELITAQKPDLLDLEEELSSISLATRVELKNIGNDVQELRRDLQRISQSAGVSLQRGAGVKDPELRPSKDEKHSCDTDPGLVEGWPHQCAPLAPGGVPLTPGVLAANAAASVLATRLDMLLQQGHAASAQQQDDVFQTIATALVESVEAQIDELDADLASVQETYESVAEFFGENLEVVSHDQLLPAHEWLGFLDHFLQDFRKSVLAHRSHLARLVAKRRSKQWSRRSLPRLPSRAAKLKFGSKSASQGSGTCTPGLHSRRKSAPGQGLGTWAKSAPQGRGTRRTRISI